MSREKQIEMDIEKIRDNETNLYSLLYNLVYKEIDLNLQFLEKIYVSFLTDKRSEIQRISIYCLLFGLQIKNEKYKEFALAKLGSAESDFDMKQFCISGLAIAYKGSKDIKLLDVFYSLYSSVHEDSDLRVAAFTGMMNLLGIESLEILKRNNNIVIFSIDDISTNLFVEEIKSIEKIISSHGL